MSFQELPTEEKPFVPMLPGLNSKDNLVTKNDIGGVYTTNSVLNTPIGKKTEGAAVRLFGPQKSREHLNLNLPNRFNFTQDNTTLTVDSKNNNTFLLHNSKMNTTYYPHPSQQNNDYYEGMSALLDKKMKSNKKNFAILNSSQQVRLHKFVAKMNGIPTKRIEKNNSVNPTDRDRDRSQGRNPMMTLMQPSFLKPISKSPLRIRKTTDRIKLATSV